MNVFACRSFYGSFRQFFDFIFCRLQQACSLAYVLHKTFNVLMFLGSNIKWVTGDGTGGSEVNIGKVTNAAECVAKCSSKKKNGKLANGATVDAATKTKCYCEFGQSGRNSAASWRNTFIRTNDIYFR